MQKSGAGYSACCPAHDDENPSLSIKEGCDGKILLHCFAGCPVDSICASLGLGVSDLFESDLTAKRSPIRTVYSYKDEQGIELYRKVRVEPGNNGRSKDFFSEHVDGNGQVVPNLQGCRRVLYSLPEVIKGIIDGKQIFLVEGEKDADKLSGYGLITTTSSESLKWTEDFTIMLTDADVILLFDMDETGIKRKDLLCDHLYSKVKRLRVVELPGLVYQESHGQDVSDWLAIGHTTEELIEIVAKTPDYSPPRKKGTIVVVTLGEFLNMQLPEREMLLSPFLPSQGLAMIYAKRGVGKTHAALGIASAVARGGKFWKWTAPKPRKVLFIDGEMPGVAIQERLLRIANTDDFDALAKGNLRLITPDLQTKPMPDLSLKSGRDAIEEFVVDCDLIIIDNISSLFRSGIENEADSWQPAQDWALDLRRRGKSILFVHHAGKGGQQRGTSKKEDILDAVICLKHPTNYRADQGAHFEVVFEKTRNFAGDAAIPFQVELCEGEDGLWSWKIEEADIDPEVMAVAELLKQEHTIKEIMEKTGLTKAKVEGRQKKARDLGLID
ncbi:MAG: AAA family ATPase [Verrucomicrobiota bacterium]|nr:AAA family ATPase [Verrucomicrobiota bacterium]